MLKSIILADDNAGISSIYNGMRNYAEKIYIYTNTKQSIDKRSCDDFIVIFLT